MGYGLLSAYYCGLDRFSSWKKSDAVVVAFVVSIIALAALGLAYGVYCAYKGMSFEYAAMLTRFTVKIGCKR